MAHQVKLITSPLVLIIILFWGGAAAQSEDCTDVVISLSPCLNHVSENSSSAPSAACCTQLGTTARSRPQCLCQALNGGGSNLGLSLNQTQALALPKACNIQTPPPTQCKAASPFGSPSSTSNTGNGSSDANSIRFTLSSVLSFFLAFASSYVALFNMV